LDYPPSPSGSLPFPDRKKLLFRRKEGEQKEIPCVPSATRAGVPLSRERQRKELEQHIISYPLLFILYPFFPHSFGSHSCPFRVIPAQAGIHSLFFSGEKKSETKEKPHSA
jgi:hypothetical protein